MPFTSNAPSFFGRFGPSQDAPQFEGLGDAYGKISAIKGPNLFETIQAVRQNELDRQTKQANIAKVLQELQSAPIDYDYKNAATQKIMSELDPNSVDTLYKQAQIKALQDKTEYQSGLLDEKQRNQDRLTSQSAIIAQFLGGVGANGDLSNLPPGSTATVGGMRIPLNRKYTAEESQLITGADSLINKIGSLKELVGTPSEGYLPFGGGMKDQQSFQTLRDDISQQLLYFRSGKAINESEYKRFMKLLPQIFRRADVDKEQLNRFIQDFQPVSERIKKGARYDESGKNLIIPENDGTSIPSVGSTYNGEKVLKVTKVA